MKASTLMSRLEAAVKNKKVSRNSNAYRMVRGFIETLVRGEGKRVIRTCHTSGRGRFTTNIDSALQVVALLGLLKVAIRTGNDAPRGGLTGSYVEVLTKIERA